MNALICFPLALALAFSQVKLVQPKPACLHYEPQVVLLKGTLKSVVRYGPPNFGETPKQDLKITVPILRLDRKMDVCADTTSEVNAEGARDVKEVQLIFLKSSAKPWYQKRVAVKGTLMFGHTGQHYTKIVMTVRRIDVAK